MREYVHRKPGEETRSGPIEFTVREEGLLDLDGGRVLYLVGDSKIGSACVGAGVLAYIYVPGIVAAWHAARSDDGSPVSSVEPVMDEETRVGLAWQTGHATNRTIVWHGGGTGGYCALIAFEPATRRGVVVLSSSANGVDDLGFHLLDPTLPLE